MKKITQIVLISFLISGLFYGVKWLRSAEMVIMEEGSSPATTATYESTRAPSPNTNVTRSRQFSRPVTKANESQQTSGEEEIFEEGSQQENVQLKPKTPAEKEMQNIPPSGTLEEEFSEEENSNNVVVTDEELQKLEQKINQLRNQILDTKSKIMELGDRISQGFISGTKLRLLLTNGFGGSFAPVKIVVKLDGYPIYEGKDPKKLEDADKTEIFSASILPENHRLDVDMIVQGKGYGIFTYMEAVKLEISATYYFSAPRGKTVTINIIPADRGSIYQLKDRPTIKFEIVE